MGINQKVYIDAIINVCSRETTYIYYYNHYCNFLTT